MGWLDYIGDVYEGYRRSDNEFQARRVENAKLFQEFRNLNPHATLEELSAEAERLSGGSNWLRARLPAEDMLRVIAERNAEAKAIEERDQAFKAFTQEETMRTSIQNRIDQELLYTEPNVLERRLAEMFPDERSQSIVQSIVGPDGLAARRTRVLNEYARSLFPSVPAGATPADIDIMFAGEPAAVRQQLKGLVQANERIRQRTAAVAAANRRQEMTTRLYESLLQDPVLANIVENSGGQVTPEFQTLIEGRARMYGLDPADIDLGFFTTYLGEANRLAEQTRTQELTSQTIANALELPEIDTRLAAATSDRDRINIIRPAAIAAGWTDATDAQLLAAVDSLAESAELGAFIERRQQHDAVRQQLLMDAERSYQDILDVGRQTLGQTVQATYGEDSDELNVARVLISNYAIPTELAQPIAAQLRDMDTDDPIAAAQAIAEQYELTTPREGLEQYRQGLLSGVGAFEPVLFTRWVTDINDRLRRETDAAQELATAPISQEEFDLTQRMILNNLDALLLEVEDRGLHPETLYQFDQTQYDLAKIMIQAGIDRVRRHTGPAPLASWEPPSAEQPAALPPPEPAPEPPPPPPPVTALPTTGVTDVRLDVLPLHLQNEVRQAAAAYIAAPIERMTVAERQERLEQFVEMLSQRLTVTKDQARSLMREAFESLSAGTNGALPVQ